MVSAGESKEAEEKSDSGDESGDGEHHMVPGWNASEREFEKKELARIAQAKAPAAIENSGKLINASAVETNAEKDNTAPASADKASEEEPPKDELDVERRRAVEDSMRMYRNRKKASKAATAARGTGPSADSFKLPTSSKQLPSRPTSEKPDAMQILLDSEMAQLTPNQREALEDRVAEAEEEEENYRSSRAAMKAKASKLAAACAANTGHQMPEVGLKEGQMATVVMHGRELLSKEPSDEQNPP